MLWENAANTVDGLSPEFIANTAHFALAHGYHVVLEGILNSARHRAPLADLIARHHGPSYVYYLDVPFDETVRRHATRPQAAEFTPEQMRGWYMPCDTLGTDGEYVIGAASTLDETVAFILATSA